MTWLYNDTELLNISDVDDTIFGERTILLKPESSGATGGVSQQGAYSEVDINAVRQTTVTLFCVTFVCGLIGNTLTIIAIATSQQIKTVATCFMLNLALADDLFMLSLPFMAHLTRTSDWPFGRGACKILSALYGVNCYASIYTMTVMSADRYLAVVHPLTSLRYRRPRNAFLVCVVVWATCVVIMTPYWMYYDVTERGSTRRCHIHWPRESEQQLRRFWLHFELIAGFVVPIIVMVVCYLLLLRGLMYTSGSLLPARARKPIRKVTAMVLIVTLVFILCWTPSYVLKYANAQKNEQFILTRIRPHPSEVKKFAVANTVAQALVFISSCCNPFIYCISSKNFRHVYMRVICQCCCQTTKMQRYLHPTTSLNGASYVGRNHGLGQGSHDSRWYKKRRDTTYEENMATTVPVNHRQSSNRTRQISNSRQVIELQQFVTCSMNGGEVQRSLSVDDVIESVGLNAPTPNLAHEGVILRRAAVETVDAIKNNEQLRGDRRLGSEQNRGSDVADLALLRRSSIRDSIDSTAKMYIYRKSVVMESDV